MRSVQWMSLVIGLLMFAGCTSLTGGDKAKSKKKESSWLPWGKKEYQIPQSMAAIWSEDVLTVAGKPPTRGFGGRLYFYNEKSQAIPVEGELVVYAYDESTPKTPGAAAPAADKRFRFTAEQFTEHFSESELGASYSVWIPWDAVGGLGKKITLIPTFTSLDGRLVRGDATKVTLAGRSPTGQPDYTPSSVRQVSHIEPTNNSMLPVPQTMQSGQQGMRTTTIQLPTSTTRRLIGPTSEPSNDSHLNEPARMPVEGLSPSPMMGAGTNVRYGNGMTPEQLQAAVASGAFGKGLANPTTMGMVSTATSQNGYPQSTNQLAGYQPANYPQGAYGMVNGQVANYAQQQTAQVQQVVQGAALQQQVPFGQPSLPNPMTPALPLSTSTPASVNGFASSEFPQVDWSQWTNHSGPNSRPAPASLGAPSNASRPH